jgi:predicted RNA-binding protein YlxR (DUF448 family)/ribosomal protein L30E
MRFVLSPEGEVVFDAKHKLPGRGVWVERNCSKVREALKRKLFAKGFKQDVQVPPDLAERIDGALVLELRGALSLTNKAGLVVSGFTRVEAAIADKLPAAVVHASDAAENGRAKIESALHKRFNDEFSVIPVVDVLSEEELSLALGRPHVVHAVILAGAGNRSFLDCWQRLKEYRG